MFQALLKDLSSFIQCSLAGNAAFPYARRGSAKAKCADQGSGELGDDDGGQREEPHLAGGRRPLPPLHGARDLPLGEVLLPPTHVTVSQFSSPFIFPPTLHNTYFVQSEH